ncbi:MAG: DUF808 domain-containing protein [Cellulomonadaceae bacterium]|jgi:predicted DNA repair protein MutK|nr:DUF808 domain-containing protein [Cellulomonadaceae bacterium]
MSAGLLGLLDDIAAIAKLAAASLDDVGAAAGRATAKAAGVVIDDTAVTPQYVHGVTADRELPIVRRIAAGSIRNKLLIILPAALLLSQFAPWALPPILIVGGTYLAYEGAEKVWERLRGHGEYATAVVQQGPDAEKGLVSGAVRTDLILSTEIMLIALAEVSHEGFWQRLAILIVVAVVMTVGVYGVVALIVKMDDMGGFLARRARTRCGRATGRGLVVGMPKLLAVISTVGTVAMLWVGGHILLRSLYDVGETWHRLGQAWTWPYETVEHLAHTVREAVPGVGAVLGWLTETALSTVVGLVVGGIALAVIHALPHQAKATAGDDKAGDLGQTTAHV